VAPGPATAKDAARPVMSRVGMMICLRTAREGTDLMTTITSP
jgi:hypothetical protein